MLAVGMGATSSELRTPCAAMSRRSASQSHLHQRTRANTHTLEPPPTAVLHQGPLRWCLTRQRGCTPVARGLDAPHVVLQHALADGAALVRLVRALHLGQLHARLERRVVDALKHLAVELLRLRGAAGSNAAPHAHTPRFSRGAGVQPPPTQRRRGAEEKEKRRVRVLRTSGLSKAMPSRIKVSARPCTPRPMGRWRMLDLRAHSGRRRRHHPPLVAAAQPTTSRRARVDQGRLNRA